MKDVFELVSANPYLAIPVGIVGFVVLVLYVVGFTQGRSVSFWPPKLGKKPVTRPKAEPASDENVSAHDAKEAAATQSGSVATASLHQLDIEIETLEGVEGSVFIFIKTPRDAFHKPHGPVDARGILATSTELHWTPETESQAISISAEWEAFVSGIASPVKYVSYHTVEVGRKEDLHVSLSIWDNVRKAKS